METNFHTKCDRAGHKISTRAIKERKVEEILAEDDQTVDSNTSDRPFGMLYNSDCFALPRTTKYGDTMLYLLVSEILNIEEITFCGQS